jgi:hypothetical protein
VRQSLDSRPPASVVKEETPTELDPADWCSSGATSDPLPLSLPPPDLYIRQPSVKLTRLEMRTENGVLSPLPLEITPLDTSLKLSENTSSAQSDTTSRKPRRKAACKSVAISPEPVPVKLRISLGGGAAVKKKKKAKRRPSAEEADSCSGSSDSESTGRSPMLCVPRQYIVPASSGESSDSEQDSSPDVRATVPSRTSSAAQERSSDSNSTNADSDADRSVSRESNNSTNDNNYVVTFIEGPDAESDGASSIESFFHESDDDESKLDPVTGIVAASNATSPVRHSENSTPASLENLGWGEVNFDSKSSSSLNDVSNENRAVTVTEHGLDTSSLASVRTSLDKDCVSSKQTSTSQALDNIVSLGSDEDDDELNSDAGSISNQLERNSARRKENSTASTEPSFSGKSRGNEKDIVASFIAEELPRVLGNIHNSLRAPHIQNKVSVSNTFILPQCFETFVGSGSRTRISDPVLDLEKQN